MLSIASSRCDRAAFWMHFQSCMRLAATCCKVWSPAGRLHICLTAGRGGVRRWGNGSLNGGRGYFIAWKEVARETADAGLEQVLASARRVSERRTDSGGFACDAMHGRHRRKAGREAVSNKVVAKFAQLGSARTGRARSDGPPSEVRRAGQWAGRPERSARRTTGRNRCLGSGLNQRLSGQDA